MKKTFKIVLIIISVLLILQMSIFLFARFGWKLYGFEMCESPDVLFVDNIIVTDDTVHIEGNTASSATSFVGYTYKVNDNILDVGIKQNLLFGFRERYGGYSFDITGDFKKIEAVYIVGRKKQKCIWSLETGK